MAETDPLSGIDGPRPLPDALHQRLEERLLDDQPRSLDADLAERLSASLSASPGHAGRSHARLTRARLTRVRVVAAAAAAVVLLGGVVGVALHRSGHHSTVGASSAPAVGKSSGASGATSAGASSRAAMPIPSAAGPGSSSPASDQPRLQEPAAPAGIAGSSTFGSASTPSRPVPGTGAPVVTAVSPGRGPVAGGTWVTISGSNLGSARTVTFGGVPAARLVVLSATSLQALSPPHAAGPVPVVVATGPAISAPVTFAYTSR